MVRLGTERTLLVSMVFLFLAACAGSGPGGSGPDEVEPVPSPIYAGAKQIAGYPGSPPSFRSIYFRAPTDDGTPKIVPQFLSFGSAEDVTFSADGKLVATLDGTPQVRIWDVLTGELRGILSGHETWARTAVFSPVESVLATTSYDGFARLWDLSTGASSVIYEGTSDDELGIGKLRYVVFSQDGRLIAVVRDRDVHVVSLDGTINTHIKGASSRVNFSPDNKTLLIWESNRGLTAWNLATGELLWNTDKGKFYYRQQTAYSPDGSVVAWCRLDDNAYLSDPETGVVKRTVPMGEPVWSVAFSSDGTRLVVGLPRSIAIFDYPTMKKLGTISDVSGKIMALSRTEKMVARSTRRLTLINLTTATKTHDFQTSDSTFNFAISADGDTVAAFPGFHEDGLLFFDTTSFKRRNSAFENPETYNIDWSPDGDAIVATRRTHGIDYSRTAHIWSAHTGQLRQTLVDDHLGRFFRGFRDIAWSPAGDRIAMSTMQDVTLWDPRTGQRVQNLDDDRNYRSEHALAFSPDGDTLATSGGEHAEIRLWNPLDGSRKGTFESGVGHVWSMSFSPDGKVLAVGGDGLVTLLDAGTGARLDTLKRGFSGVEDLTWTPDSSILLVGTSRGTAHGFRVSTKEELWRFRYKLKMKFRNVRRRFAEIRSVSVSHDGKFAAFGIQPSGLQIRDVEKGELVADIDGMRGGVASVAWHPRKPVLAATRGGIQLTCATNGNTLVLRSIDREDKPLGLAYTDEGFFSGDRDAFEFLRFRKGMNIKEAPLLSASEVEAQYYRPNLVAEFLRACPI